MTHRMFSLLGLFEHLIGITKGFVATCFFQIEDRRVIQFEIVSIYPNVWVSTS